MLPNLLGIVFAEEQCTPLADGIVLSKYYLETCAACKRLNPILEEIKSQANKLQIPIKFREVECTGCECDGITNFPTLELTQDKSSVGKSVGYKNYSNLSKWIRDTLLLDKEVFTNHIEHTEGVVKELNSIDFLTGFDGQWLILFYEDKHDVRRSLFKELAKIFGGKLTLAEVHKSESENMATRYNISEYPLIMGINQSTPVPFSGKVDLASLSSFVEKLYTPSFQEISYQEIKEKSNEFKNGESLYVVLYKNFEIASYYFNDIAQQFKFKATIYRSSDPAMFAAAGYHPKDLNDFKDGPNHNEMVYLALYKNSSFFLSPEKLDQTQDTIAWIFHTHFPHVTNISNENFYTVFHGIKPVVVLLTKSENLLEAYNKTCASWNLGAATSSMIFTTLDTIEYPLFKKKILDTVREPAIVFYDPIQSRWYYQPTKLTEENLNNTVMTMIDAYLNGKLPAYPPEPKKYGIFVIVALSIVSSVIVFCYLNNRKKVID